MLGKQTRGNRTIEHTQWGVLSEVGQPVKDVVSRKEPLQHR